MGMIFIGAAAKLFVERIARERDLTQGANRLLDNGQVKLDSVKAWAGRNDHALDGSTVQAIYIAGRDADAQAVAEAEPVRNAGVSPHLIIGRLIDVKTTREGSGLCLCTNGLRQENQFRCISTHVGALVAIAIDMPLVVSVEEACRIAGVDVTGAQVAVTDAVTGTTHVSAPVSAPAAEVQPGQVRLRKIGDE